MGRTFRKDGNYDGRTKSGKLGKKIAWAISAFVILLALIMALVG